MSDSNVCILILYKMLCNKFKILYKQMLSLRNIAMQQCSNNILAVALHR